SRFTSSRFIPFSFREESLDGVNRRLALYGGDALEQRDVFRADFDAVAGFAAVGDAAFAHESFQAFAFEGFADGVIVEEAGLADHCGADEVIGWGVLRA